MVQDLFEDRESKDTVNTSVDILQSNGIEFECGFGMILEYSI